MRKKVGDELNESPHYGYPVEVLRFIRDIVPGNIKGEDREDAYPVSLYTFCETLDIEKNYK